MNKLISDLCALAKLSILTIALCLCGCIDNEHAAKSDIQGNYVADYGTAKEHLIFLPGGKFIQKVTIRATGKTYLARGTWRFDVMAQDAILDGNYIDVLGINALNKNSTKKRPIVTRLQVEWIPGNALGLGWYDFGPQYEKLPPSIPTKKPGDKAI